jgi:hypothetical protein
MARMPDDLFMSSLYPRIPGQTRYESPEKQTSTDKGKNSFEKNEILVSPPGLDPNARQQGNSGHVN